MLPPVTDLIAAQLHHDRVCHAERSEASRIPSVIQTWDSDE